jgi:CheY-like chemotaxis protein
MKQPSDGEQRKKETSIPTNPQGQSSSFEPQSRMPARILVVEDEFIIALDIQDKLTEWGHSVVGITALGEESVDLAEKLKPDLVLMDIHLRGQLDGVAAAGQIHSRFSIPIVYVTSDAAVATAQATQPFGYILKPFMAQDLGMGVERALLKHQAD